WSVVVFVILFILLKKYAWSPILGAVKGREESINNALDSAEFARKEVQNLKADMENILQEEGVKKTGLLKKERAFKNRLLAEAKETAQTQADKIIKQAQVIIEGEKQAAIAELKKQVATLSVEIAEKIVKEQLADHDKQLKLVDTMLDQVTLN